MMMNFLDVFLNYYCLIAANGRVRAFDLLLKYYAFCLNMGIICSSQDRIVALLYKKGFKYDPETQTFHGLTLLPPSLIEKRTEEEHYEF